MEISFCSRCGTALARDAAFCSRCGSAVTALPPTSVDARPVAQFGSSFNPWAAALVLGGGLLASGSLLPWLSGPALILVPASGFDTGEAVVPLVIGVVIALAGLMHLARPGVPGSRLALVALGVAGVVFVCYEYLAEAARVARLDPLLFAFLSLGSGMYVMGVGAIVSMLVSALAPSGHPEPPRRLCAHCGKPVNPDRRSLCNNCGLPFGGDRGI